MTIERRKVADALMRSAQRRLRHAEVARDLPLPVIASAFDVFSNAGAVAEFLVSPAQGLNGRVPLEVCRTAGGRNEWKRYSWE
jgi:uncharacterized protein (DUF2384 family)